MSHSSTATMVATLGGQPQVVTSALDALLAAGVPIDNVVVLHLNDQAGRTQRSLKKLAAAFASERYAQIRYQPHPIRNDQVRLADIYDETDASVAWTEVHNLFADLRAPRRALHVCISGGRRILALLVMSAAMLHFDHNDSLWHMYTPRELQLQADEGALMHLPPESGFRLIRVPMLPWGSYFPMLRKLAQPNGNPGDVLAGPRSWLDNDERERCQEVVDRLTIRQRDVLRAFAQGLSPQEVAEELHVTIKTVDTHKTAILKECRNAWAIAPDHWLDYHFLANKFDRFFLPE